MESQLSISYRNSGKLIPLIRHLSLANNVSVNLRIHVPYEDGISTYVPICA